MNGRLPTSTRHGDTKCRSCGALICWCWTTRGKLQPVDPDPHPDGNVRVDLDDMGTRFVYVDPGPDLLGGDRYMPHHATCPQADQWRGSTP